MRRGTRPRKCRALRQLRCVAQALEGCAAGCPGNRLPVPEPETYVPVGVLRLFAPGR